MRRVDVAINVYGKPYQTAVTLFSLIRFSGHHINRIFFTKEAKQPIGSDFEFLLKRLADRVTVYTPKFWLFVSAYDASRLSDIDYRWSIRYQFAWEKSDADYLYLTHNDVLYRDDVLGRLLENIGEYSGIGQIGQCWNCPAFSARVCDGNKYLEYQPSYAEALRLYEEYPSGRPFAADYLDERQTWPLPECRLNEWVALLNLRKVRPDTIPIGTAAPLGALKLDTGTQWFRDMVLKGHRFKNFDFSKLAQHDWTAEGQGGHAALRDSRLYDRSESVAREKLITDFPIDPRELRATDFKARLRREMKYVSEQATNFKARLGKAVRLCFSTK